MSLGTPWVSIPGSFLFTLDFWPERSRQEPRIASDRASCSLVLASILPLPARMDTVRALIQVPLKSRAWVPVFLVVFDVFGRFPWAPGRLSYPPGPTLGPVFLWRCFCRQKPSRTRKLVYMLGRGWEGLGSDRQSLISCFFKINLVSGWLGVDPGLGPAPQINSQAIS